MLSTYSYNGTGYIALLDREWERRDGVGSTIGAARGRAEMASGWPWGKKVSYTMHLFSILANK